MQASTDRIQWFLETYCASGFRHAEVVIPFLQRNDPAESTTSLCAIPLDEGLRRTYRRRAKHLAKSPPSPFFPPGLAADVRALADGLDSARDQIVRVWDTQLPSGTCYVVFELAADRTIAGCYRSADQTVVNPDAW